VIICLGPPLPTASSGARVSGRVSWPTVVPGPCSQPGFTEPAPLDAAGALLPHPCTLACARGQAPAIGGVFLWHSPHGHPHWALPSKPGHWGARTFLNRDLILQFSEFDPRHGKRAARVSRVFAIQADTGMGLWLLFLNQFSHTSFRCGACIGFARFLEQLKHELKHGVVTIRVMTYGSIAKK
jgi:hypothetical protein